MVFFYQLGYFVDRFEVAVGGNGETGFDYVHAHFLKGFGDPYFFVEVHGGARRLFAITQGRVENYHFV